MGTKEIRSSIYFYPFSQQINHTLSESQQYVMSSLYDVEEGITSNFTWKSLNFEMTSSTFNIQSHK